MFPKIMIFVMVLLLVGCGGGDILGIEDEPNVGADEFPSQEEIDDYNQYLQDKWNRQADEAQREMELWNAESTADTMYAENESGGTRLGLEDARATAQVILEQEGIDIQSSVQNGCPNGCTDHKPGCDIKGNISINSGEKIYHVLGGEWYDETNISPAYGERWFCNEEEAKNNGWRKSKE